jgi:hypothetical protein
MKYTLESKIEDMLIDLVRFCVENELSQSDVQGLASARAREIIEYFTKN